MRNFKLSLLSGLLLAFSWPEIGFFPIIIIAFVPLFILEHEIGESELKRKGRYVFWYSFLAFLLFNIITTYWVWNASIGGALFAFIVNSFLMTFVFWVFHKAKNILGNRLGYLMFLVCWLSMEYLHLNWSLAWPWLILGNVFANNPSLVQWYEYTGFLGGSVVVILINLAIFKHYLYRNKWKSSIPIYILLISPFIASIFFLNDINQKAYDEIEVVIVQPNLDPYKEKFTIPAEDQLADFISLAKSKLTTSTSLLIGPETALQESILENNINKSSSIYRLQELQDSFPKLSILIGATTHRMFGKNDKKSTTTRKMKDADVWLDFYNSAIYLSSDKSISIYHKTKLVPGAEGIPYPKIFGKIASLIVNLGGASGSLSRENNILTFKEGNYTTKPLICYESVFGDINSSEPSNLLCVITNDGWWKKTAGYKQHLSYAQIRAIEQRKSLVRSANTGISCVISPKGEVVAKTDWNEKIAINHTVSLFKSNTFYNQYGDYIGRISSFLTVLLLLITITRYKTK